MAPAAKVRKGYLQNFRHSHEHEDDWRTVGWSAAISLDLQTMAFRAIVSYDRDWFAQHMQTTREHRRRSISASICLLVVVLLYAPLAGAAWSSYQSACCTSDQCPIPEHHHHKAPASPANHMDCGHDMAAMMACTMSCCHDSDRSMVASIAFVLPPVIAVAAPGAIKSPVQSARPLDLQRSIEPLSPPPRLVPAVA
jgi:hypothetical protein